MSELQRLRHNVRADVTAIARLKGHEKLTAGAVLDVITLPGTCAVIVFRVASALHHSHLRPFSRMLYFLNMVLFSADYAPAAQVGPGLVIPHPVGSAWSADTVIGSNVTLTGMVRVGGGAAERGAPDGAPIIEDDVWMFDGSKAFGPVRIGARSIIGANAVVLSDIPPDVVAAGHPAKVIKHRSSRPGSPYDELVAPDTVTAR